MNLEARTDERDVGALCGLARTDSLALGNSLSGVTVPPIPKRGALDQIGEQFEYLHKEIQELKGLVFTTGEMLFSADEELCEDLNCPRPGGAFPTISWDIDRAISEIRKIKEVATTTRENLG